jgi:transcriptional regulator with XRE-family HTH domain
MNKAKIKGRMAELGIQQKDIAQAWNCAVPTVSQKINGIRPIDLTEAEILAKLLKLSDLEYYVFFFESEIA